MLLRIHPRPNRKRALQLGATISDQYVTFGPLVMSMQEMQESPFFALFAPELVSGGGVGGGGGGGSGRLAAGLL